jgi:hypothetical protein
MLAGRSGKRRLLRRRRGSSSGGRRRSGLGRTLTHLLGLHLRLGFLFRVALASPHAAGRDFHVGGYVLNRLPLPQLLHNRVAINLGRGMCRRNWYRERHHQSEHRGSSSNREFTHKFHTLRFRPIRPRRPVFQNRRAAAKRPRGVAKCRFREPNPPLSIPILFSATRNPGISADVSRARPTRLHARRR